MKDIHVALAQGHWAGDQQSTMDLYRDLVAVPRSLALA